MSDPTENNDANCIMLSAITLHGAFEFGLGEESSHVFAGDDVMNGAIVVSVTD